MSFLRACSALAVALFLVLLSAMLVGTVVFTRCGSSQPRWSYLSEDGVAYIRYQTIKHSTSVVSDERHLPLPEALAQAEKDFGAPFNAPVAEPRRVFVSYILVYVDVPESAYRLGKYPTIHMELVLGANFLPDGSLDPAQIPGMATDANLWLDITRPVEGLRVGPTVSLVEVESSTAGTVYIQQFQEADGTAKDVRFYWLDGDTQYMLDYFPVGITHTREEMLALVDLIASQ